MLVFLRYLFGFHTPPSVRDRQDVDAFRAATDSERSRKGREFEAEAHRIAAERDAEAAAYDEIDRAFEVDPAKARIEAIDRFTGVHFQGECKTEPCPACDASRAHAQTLKDPHPVEAFRNECDEGLFGRPERGPVVPWSIPREVDGYAAWVEREAAAAKLRNQGPDEALGDHLAEPGWVINPRHGVSGPWGFAYFEWLYPETVT